MTSDDIRADHVDALVVGGGFYGCSIALALKRELRLDRVRLVERGSGLMQRASYANQARLHNGYHYPRSLTTAIRSRINLPRFAGQYRNCVVDGVESLYAIARRNSKVSARQFAKFCDQIGADIRPAPPELTRLFDERAIEAVYLVTEHAFDTTRLRTQIEAELTESGVDVQPSARVLSVAFDDLNRFRVDIDCDAGDCTATADWVFNCTYAGLNNIGGLRHSGSRLKFEITEMALMAAPGELMGRAVTVMDGPFFSTLPFPDRGLHTLSHVRYTPHFSWTPGEVADADPYDVLAAYDKPSRAGRMIRDAARYMPCLAGVEPVDSLFEVKTVLLANEVDDGRPILFERHPDHERCYSVLGGKIDNVYDICAMLKELPIHG